MAPCVLTVDHPSSSSTWSGHEYKRAGFAIREERACASVPGMQHSKGCSTQLNPPSLLACTVHIAAGTYEVLHTYWRQICKSTAHGADGPGTHPLLCSLPLGAYTLPSCAIHFPRASSLSSLALSSSPVRPPQPYAAAGAEGTRVGLMGKHTGEENRARGGERRTRQSRDSTRTTTLRPKAKTL